MIFATVRMPVGAENPDLLPLPSKMRSSLVLRKCLATHPSAPAKSPVLIFPPTGPSAWRMFAGPHDVSLPGVCSKSRKTTRSSMPRLPRDPSGCAFRAERSHVPTWCARPVPDLKTHGQSKSGRLFRVASRAVSRRQFSMAAWLPPSRISGTFQPLYSAGRV